MTGNVVDRLGTQAATVSSVLNNGTATAASSNTMIDPSYAIAIATTTGFTVGVIQVI